MAVRTYDKSTKVSKNFNSSEFACPCCGQCKIDDELIEVVQNVREWAAAPVKINSSYRCDLHNKEVGGAPKSMHKEGKAADIVVSGKTPEEVREYLKDYVGGLGSYKTFTHVDVRGYTARWKA